MSDEMNHDDLDKLLRGVDPLAPDAKPGEHESRAALNELRATRLSDVNAGARSRFPRPRVLAGGTLALGASATVATLALGAFSSSPAFAVTSNDNGTVTVKMFRPGDVTALNARLHALGVRAKFIQVNAIATGCPTPGAVPTRVTLPHAVVITPGKIPSNKTLMLGADGAGHVGYLPKAVLQRITAAGPVNMVKGHLVGPGGKIHVAPGDPVIPQAVGPNGAIVVRPAPANTSTTGANTGTATTQTATTTGGGFSTQPSTATAAPPALLRAVAAVHCVTQGAAGTSTTGTTTNTSTTDMSTTNPSTGAAN